jgi:hypothetical protein
VKASSILASALGISTLSLAIPSAAQAISLTPTQTISFGPAQTDFTQNLTFDKFDPSLGTLTSVHISAVINGVSGQLPNGTPEGSIFCQIPGGTGTCVTTFESQLVITLSVGAVNLGTSTTSLVPFTTFTLPGGGFTTLPVVPGTGSISYNNDQNILLGHPATLALFNGPGTVNLTFFADGQNSFNDTTGNSIFGNPISASITAQLFYDYIPVPAPLPLLGVGAAFGWSRKIRKRIKSSKPDVIPTVTV